MRVLDFTSARRQRLLAEIDAVLVRWPDTRTNGQALVDALDSESAISELWLTQSVGCEIEKDMSRHKEENRSNVTSREHGYVAMRLTPIEESSLDSLVAIQQKAVDELNLPTKVGAATVIRSLIKREAIAKGVWADKQLSLPTPAQAEPQVDMGAIRATVRQAIATLSPKHRKLIPILELRKALPTVSKQTLDVALLELEDIGEIDLKVANDPEGLDVLQGIDQRPARGLCWFVATHNNMTQVARFDVDSLRKRIESALSGKAKRFDSAADLAKAADVSQNDVSRFRKGHGLTDEKLSRLDAVV